MLRIHFTTQDLARTHVAERPDAMWETVLSLHMLRARYARTAFSLWRSEVGGRLHRDGLSAKVRADLVPLAPNGTYFPDFLTPPEGLIGAEEGVEAVMATPRELVVRDLELLERRHGAPAWSLRLADRGTGARKSLGRMLGSYHRAAVEPYWGAVCDRVAADRARRGRALRSGGPAALLESFGPAMRWRPPVLEVDKGRVDLDIHLRGRGLLLIPSHFCWYRPITLADPDRPPVLVYPIDPDPLWLRPPPGSAPDPGPALSRLLGATRAAILRSVADGMTTTEVACQLGVSPAAVSQHTAVLRESGLMVSLRDGNTVIHTTTALGRAVIEGESARRRRD
ncbi:ArsR/SmtB family transcription factor [Streptomonospora wellingtoniae]|uniref:DUF5937 family protein n=1 Tax=Streptomonospora wellingtoniae TaxID=3075544 RepID=A0ABU2L159_9ACTN|nr:DUF5937 family protein [Streptomonospora sp. DSM 45055]MDT0305232.1 DUF5937 family protein [Streptomonospora sp. DSM 45055]